MKEQVTDKPELREIPEPIGNIILKAVEEGRINQVMAADGAYYHYVDVCNLLSPLKEENDKLREALKEAVNALQWHLDKSKPDNPVDQSDFFHYTANAISQGEQLLSPPIGRDKQK